MPRDNVMRTSLLFLILDSYFLIIGRAVHPGCDCLVYSTTFGKEQGIFTSPDFPKPYPPNIDCILYSFMGEANEIVEIRFQEFDVKRKHLDCFQGDYLKLFLHLEGQKGVNEYTPWETLLCGSMFDVPMVLYSSGPELILEFHTGMETSNATGFSGTFKFMDKGLFKTTGQKLPGSVCDYLFTSANYVPPHGHFYSPRYPSSYPKNVKCSYRFRARHNERIHIVFEEIYLQRGDLREDIIRIYDGISSSDSAVKFLCNEATDIEVRASGSSLYVEFVANSNWPGQGFKAKYQFLPSVEDNFIGYQNKGGLQNLKTADPNVSETQIMQANAGEPPRHTIGSSCDIVFSSDNVKNGTFSSPHYPHPYPSSTICKYKFEGSGRERIQIVFLDFHLHSTGRYPKDCGDQDVVMIFVQVEGRLDKVDGLCGSSPPKSVMSNGPNLLLEIWSALDVHISGGFRAWYGFVENYGINSGVQMSQYPCAFVYNSNDSKSGDIHSPNYPGAYPREVECHYFFYGHDSERVHLHFHYFDVEGVGACDGITESDYVEFSNFMSIDPKFRRYCGHLDKFDIKSDRKFFRLTFKSNNRLDGHGFNATYNFFDEIEIVETANSKAKTSLVHSETQQYVYIGIMAAWFYFQWML